jgi:hypothetical protein
MNDPSSRNQFSFTAPCPLVSIMRWHSSPALLSSTPWENKRGDSKRGQTKSVDEQCESVTHLSDDVLVPALVAHVLASQLGDELGEAVGGHAAWSRVLGLRV